MAGSKASFQTRALARKALSYQKRQWFSNICCLTLCPLSMVIVSAILGTVIQTLLTNGSEIEEILYCAQSFALSPQGVPLLNVSDPRIPNLDSSDIPRATLDTAKRVNFMQLAEEFTGGGPVSSLAARAPCVYWFGRDYPVNEASPYAQPARAASSRLSQDSTFLPQVPGGWLGLVASLASAELTPDLINDLSYFQDVQLRPWYLVAKSGDAENLDYGTASSQQPDLSLDTLITGSSPATNFSAASPGGGLFDSFEPRLYVDISTAANGTPAFSALQQVPFYEPVSDTSAELSARIVAALDRVNLLDKSPLLDADAPRADLLAYYSRANRELLEVPYGAVTFTRADFTSKQFDVRMQIGTDERLASASGFPGEGVRQAYQMTMINNALLRASNASNAAVAGAAITQGLRAFPQLQSTEVVFPAAGIIGGILFPFGVSFLLPIFVVALVKEKEERIFVMMRINGLHLGTYYASQYITFFLLFILSTLVFLIGGFAAGIELFTQTALDVLILVFFIWGLAQNALVFLFASVLDKSRTALAQLFEAGVYLAPSDDCIQEIPFAYFLWPPFAFYRTLQLLNDASYIVSVPAYTISRIVPGDEVFAALLFMVFESIILLLVAFYLSAVIPSEFGVPRPWHFPITDTIKAIRGDKGKPDGDGGDVSVEAEMEKLEDMDVKAERDRVDSNQHASDSPLVLSHLRKVYPPRGGLGPKVAVRDVTLAVEEGVVLGLLGPNGAGKTTVISCLTGLYRSSGGHAKLAGWDVDKETSKVYQNIGTCPQFDILWEDLTVGEHLYFYARLKGVAAKDERAVVQESLKTVSLTPFEDRLTKGLSGGEKRRLSIAISLIGDPSVVFLDEPTTGLDPEVRRLIWTIINDARKGKTIVLTTHSMEEAEALCQRIGIMAKGALRCLGPALRLKELYGSGFKLFFNSLATDTPRACEFVEKLLPEGWKKMDAFTTNTSYEFPGTEGAIAKLFKQVESQKEAYGIIDWGVSQTSLEEVFLRIISDSDAQAD